MFIVRLIVAQVQEAVKYLLDFLVNFPIAVQHI